MGAAKKTLYAAIGAGTTVVGKARELPGRISIDLKLPDVRSIPSKVQQLPSKAQALGTSLPERATKLVDGSKRLTERATERASGLFTELTKRGEELYGRIQRSAPTRNAVAQTKAARSKVKAAATSVKKAAGADVEAAKGAVEKATEATA